MTRPGWSVASATLLAPLVLLTAVPAAGQTAEAFDLDRALLTDEPFFDAFYPTEYERLDDVRSSGRVNDDTALLVLRRGDTSLALLTMQMSYHHIAQGEMAGEPWMVSF